MIRAIDKLTILMSLIDITRSGIMSVSAPRVSITDNPSVPDYVSLSPNFDESFSPSNLHTISQRKGEEGRAPPLGRNLTGKLDIFDGPRLVLTLRVDIHPVTINAGCVEDCDNAGLVYRIPCSPQNQIDASLSGNLSDHLGCFVVIRSSHFLGSSFRCSLIG